MSNRFPGHCVSVDAAAWECTKRAARCSSAGSGPADDRLNDC